jgi:CzcA family heavy metal efflux pump
MLNAIIRASLKFRVLVLLAAVLAMVYGTYTAVNLPTDVLPNLNRPVVTVMTEAPGLAPEEVETQVSFHIETAVNGAPGVERVRSVSGLGLSIVYVEFTWDTDLRYARQTVQERLVQATEKLPPGVVPAMGPVSSIMGEIMLIGLQSPTQSPMEVRALADWVVRPALLSVPGVSQMTVMGGELKQFQVKADPDRLRLFGLTMEDLETALAKSNQNTGGGFIVGKSQELVVRNIGRVRSVEDIESSLVAMRTSPDEHGNRAVLVRDVARVVEAGSSIKRGEGSMNGSPAVIMAVQKQPTADTRDLTRRIDLALEGLKPTLPKDLVLNADLFRQAHFIQQAIDNVIEALRDGSIFVVIVLVLFLLNVRTTLITLTALPLSLVMTALVFAAFGMSVNTMTLGGIAVAIGELVDDAVVGVENVFRRLRENRAGPNPRSPAYIVYEASSEVRNAILIGTMIVLLVFIPLFALSGIEGRLFRPLAVAYIVSIFSSMVVSLTVTPVLSLYLLPGMKRMAHGRDGVVLRFFKAVARRAYALTLPRPMTVISICGALVLVGGFLVTRLGVEFLPPFNEGTATVNVIAQPGVALAESDRLGRKAEELLLTIPEVKSTGRRTGRAEQDEHAEGVHYSEIDVDFWTKQEAKHPDASATAAGRKPPSKVRPRPEVFAEMQAQLEVIPGVVVSIGQPIGHRIDHLLSGVRAQIAVKFSGDNLGTLRKLADQARAAMDGIPGVADLQVEQQVLVPQVHLRVKRDAAARVGFATAQLTDALEAAVKGKVVSQVLDGLQSFDMVLKLDERWTQDLHRLGDIRLLSPSGAVVLLSDVASIVEQRGPNQVLREDLRRRIVVQCNVRGRDLGSTVNELAKSIAMDVKLPQGYALSIGGQFESQREATRILTLLGAASLVAMFFVLYSSYRSAVLALQIMLNVPFAFIGSVGTLYLTGTEFSVASLVGFISLTGIATRNGVLMISHYIHLITHEGVPFGKDMVVRGSQERVAPVLMTAFTSSLALIPLAISRGQPGREILHPVALVVLGGLLTSTALDFFVRPTVFLRFGRKAAERLIERYQRGAEDFSESPSRLAQATAAPPQPQRLDGAAVSVTTTPSEKGIGP